MASKPAKVVPRKRSEVRKRDSFASPISSEDGQHLLALGPGVCILMQKRIVMRVRYQS